MLTHRSLKVPHAVLLLLSPPWVLNSLPPCLLCRAPAQSFPTQPPQLPGPPDSQQKLLNLSLAFRAQPAHVHLLCCSNSAPSPLLPTGGASCAHLPPRVAFSASPQSLLQLVCACFSGNTESRSNILGNYLKTLKQSIGQGT